MKRESRNDFLLRLWKSRQEKEGIDVSSVKTLEQAEHFFEKPIEKKLEDLTKKELLVMAKEKGLELSDRLTKSDIINAINSEEETVEETEIVIETSEDVEEGTEETLEIEELPNNQTGEEVTQSEEIEE